MKYQTLLYTYVTKIQFFNITWILTDILNYYTYITVMEITLLCVQLIERPYHYLETHQH